MTLLRFRARDRGEGKPSDMTATSPLSTRISWSALGTIIASVGRLVSASIVARYLGPELNGQYVFASWLVEFTVTFVGMGLPVAVTRFVAEAKGRSDALSLQRIAHWTLRCYVVVMLFGGVITYFVVTVWMFNDLREVAWPLVIALLVFQLWSGLAQAFLTGFQQFDSIAKITIVSAIVLALVQAFCSSRWGVNGALIGAITGQSVMACVVIRILKKLLSSAENIKPTGVSAHFERGFFSYSINVWFAGIITAIVWGRAELFFLQRYSTDDQLGYFGISTVLASIVVQVVNLLSAALLPHFAMLLGQQNHEALRADYRRLTLIAALVSLPISFGGAALMPELILVLFGSAYDNAVDACRVMMMTGLWAFAAVGSAAIYGMGRARLIVQMGVLGVSMTVVSCLVLVPIAGAVGAASARWLVQCCMILVGTVVLRYRYDLPFPGLLIVRLVFCAFLSALAARFAADLIQNTMVALSIAILAGGATYLAALYFSGATRVAEFTSVRDRFTVAMELFAVQFARALRRTGEK